MAGHYDQAIKEEMAVLDLDPDHDQARYWLGYAYEQKGMYKNAIAEYEKVLRRPSCCWYWNLSGPPTGCSPARRPRPSALSPHPSSRSCNASARALS